eukprot:10155128-Karenia_brevis.AAC.1
MEALHMLYVHGSLRPRCDHVDWSRHVFREFNARADKLAGNALTARASNFKEEGLLSEARCICT